MSISHYRVGRKEGKPDFMLATTCASGRPCANYVMSLVDSTAYLAGQGVAFDYWLHNEDCHVDDARNFIVRQFVESEAPFLVFIDDDVGWDTESLARLILYKNVDIVGGAYPLKQHNEEYPIRLLAGKSILQAREDGLLEVAGVPTGFMRIERHVIDALMKKRKHLTYVPKEGFADDARLTVIFERMMVDGKRWSGDLNFCREAKLAGFHIWVDPEMSFTHQGNNRWEGTFGMWLRQKQEIMDPRLDMAINQLITGDDSLEVFAAICARNANPFSMSPTGLKEVYTQCKNATAPILEVGSGISTIIAGIACMRNGQIVHSLEADLEWFQKVRKYIQRWKIKSIALYYSPLKEYDDFSWYEIDDNLPKEFGVAIIDGPVRRYGREGVYKLMMDRIKRAVWIMDDADDPVQLSLLTKYAKEQGKTVEDVGKKLRGKRRFAIARDTKESQIVNAA